MVDRKDAFTITGTVYGSRSLEAGERGEVAIISVGLHPAGMTISGANLYVANAYSDSVSVIDLDSDKVVRTISLGGADLRRCVRVRPQRDCRHRGGPGFCHLGPGQCRGRDQSCGARRQSGHRLYPHRLFSHLHRL